jgi:sporulation protein YlmC with PRC-barrel domain
MIRSAFLVSVAACLWLGLASPMLAADPVATAGAVKQLPSNEMAANSKDTAEKCLTDLRMFDHKMETDGYWFGWSGYAYGNPMSGGYAYDYPMGGHPPPTPLRYPNARLGYEFRELMISANILARRGRQEPCEAVLGMTQRIYTTYVAQLKSDKVPTASNSGWRQQEIAGAKPVANVAFRSDQLIGTAVRTPYDDALGSVADIVMSPQTSKIAYLVVARGGIFGIDDEYIPVPWADFRASPNVNVLILNATRDAMTAAPRVDRDQFTVKGRFEQESQKIDAYWTSHVSGTGNN